MSNSLLLVEAGISLGLVALEFPQWTWLVWRSQKQHEELKWFNADWGVLSWLSNALDTLGSNKVLYSRFYDFSNGLWISQSLNWWKNAFVPPSIAFEALKKSPPSYHQNSTGASQQHPQVIITTTGWFPQSFQQPHRLCHYKATKSTRPHREIHAAYYAHERFFISKAVLGKFRISICVLTSMSGLSSTTLRSLFLKFSKRLRSLKALRWSNFQLSLDAMKYTFLLCSRVRWDATYSVFRVLFNLTRSLICCSRTLVYLSRWTNLAVMPAVGEEGVSGRDMLRKLDIG